MSLVLCITMFTFTFVGCGKDDKDTANETTPTTASETTTPTKAATSNESTTATAAPDANTEEYSINVHVGPEPETIDPTMNTSVDGSSLINHAFEGLMRLYPDGTIGSGAAESYKVSDDGLTYTYKIRSDAKWSDGKDLTADAFVYSWQRLVDPATASNYNYIIDMVKNANEIMAGTLDKAELGIKAVDSKTVEITLAVACPYFTEICAFPATYPLRQDVIEANPDTWSTEPATYIGNGPYVLKTWTHQSEMVYEKNSNYYGVADLGPQTINFKLMDDYNTVLSSFENGEIIFGEDIPSEEIERMKENGLYIAGQLGTYFICLNVNNDALKDVKVRKALALAIDRNYIVTNVSKAGEQPADTFVATGLSDVEPSTEFHSVATPWYSVDAADYTANVAEAKKLLEEAGYPNGEGFPTLEYILNTSTNHQAIAEAITYMWETELGIHSTISAQDWSVFIDTRDKGEYQVARHGWLADYNDPISFLDMWVTGGGNNDANYASKEYDDLIAKVKATSVREERIKYMHEAEDVLAKDMPIIPIYFYTDMYLKSDKLDGFYASPLGYKYFMYAKVKE